MHAKFREDRLNGLEDIDKSVGGRWRKEEEEGGGGGGGGRKK